MPPMGHGLWHAHGVPGEGISMDRAELPEESIHEMGALFVTALRAAATNFSVDDLDGIERRLQAAGRQVLSPGLERGPARTAAG